MALERPSPKVQLILLWAGLPILLYGLVSARGSLQERWEAQPPTEIEETDCRIESMMGGDNPVEVERIYRTCADAASDAYVRPRARRITLLFALLALAYGSVVWFMTRRYRAPGAAGAR